MSAPFPPSDGQHKPCCSSHGVDMDCTRYRRTHFIEVGPCCSYWAANHQAVAR